MRSKQTKRCCCEFNVCQLPGTKKRSTERERVKGKSKYKGLSLLLPPTGFFFFFFFNVASIYWGIIFGFWNLEQGYRDAGVREDEEEEEVGIHVAAKVYKIRRARPEFSQVFIRGIPRDVFRVVKRVREEQRGVKERRDAARRALESVPNLELQYPFISERHTRSYSWESQGPRNAGAI